MITLLKNRTALVAFGIAFAFGVALGAYVTYQYFPRVIEKRVEIEKPIISETITTETITEIQYVTKDRDPFTGQKENTDVEANIGRPTIGVKVNGKPYEFGLLQGESQKFGEGKIVMNQESKIQVEVEVPTIVQKWRVGAYVDWTAGEGHPNVGARLNRRFKRWDGDVYINQDKDVKGQVTIWF